MRTIKEGIEDLERIKAMGFRGVMMPGNPGEKDYDSTRPSIRSGRPPSRSSCRSRSTS